MRPTTTARPALRLAEISYSPAQVRVLTAALDLFADNGVAGTTLQMIADRMGVTKAAIYHQFRTKEEIVIATADYHSVPLEAAVERAEAAQDRVEARRVLLQQLIDFAVRNRAGVSAWRGDPVMTRILMKHEPFRGLTERIYTLLVNEDAGAGGVDAGADRADRADRAGVDGEERENDSRIPAAILVGVITAVGQPGLAAIDPRILREQVFRYACRLLNLPD
ncbi:TetR family transcriptional regulator [Frankia sp. CcI49]|uniref:TetR/AcrR family transcriptional regulator n=1 Tax=unclassified Frankia TaxID=2632575 RepID=UPI0006CA26CA|nr:MULTISPECIES: helix-turn-helix domain-containing protein [unclassified Frankia]KPM56837.1 TetR family transcriptional regulator [Frankia sp. R43]ONH50581.1 TetR family transcriptional regulator [Frankia sp. CcI49]